MFQVVIILEKIYSLKLIREKPVFLFLMGLTYAITGIASAIFLFPNSPGFAAIAFTSLLCVPVLEVMFSREKDFYGRASNSKFGVFSAYSKLLTTYASLFFGIMFAFLMFSALWPPKATFLVFSPQLRMLGSSGNAFSPSTFLVLLSNNSYVLLFCFVISLIYGVGGVLMMVWNASVWGSVLGIFIRDAVVSGSTFQMLLTLLKMLPHTLLESGSYFLAVIAGIILSRTVVSEKRFSEIFYARVRDCVTLIGISIILVVLGAYLESSLF
ncbi:MAG: stage II sporulation protein M [Candidatus Woesearchaeota archaeon]